MRKILGSLPIIFIALGLAFALGGYKNAMLLMTDKRLNINEASVSDLNEEAIAEGNITFVYGPFAVLETTHKTYGITTSKDETKYYIVGNFDMSTFSKYFEGEDIDMCYMVMSVADTKLQKELDAAANKWVNFLTYTDEADLPPQISIKVDGILAKQSTDLDYKQYYQDAKKDLSNVGITESQFAEMMIREGKVTPFETYGTFFGGIAMVVLGIVILIAAIVKSRKSNSMTW